MCHIFTSKYIFFFNCKAHSSIIMLYFYMVRRKFNITMFIVDFITIYEWITDNWLIWWMGMISMPWECMNGAVLNHQRQHRTQADHNAPNLTLWFYLIISTCKSCTYGIYSDSLSTHWIGLSKWCNTSDML